MRSQRWVALLACVFLAFGGCRTVPDLKPFADATAEIDLAANRTYDFVVEDLTALAQQAPNRTQQDRAVRSGLENARNNFSGEWKIRLEATAALVEYSASLASIAAAGMEGSEGAHALANSANELLGSIPNVTAQIPAAAINVAAWIKDEVDKVRAAESLAAAVKEADPAIKQIANILAEDFATVAARIDGNVVAAQTLINYQYGSIPTYHASLIERQKAVATRIEKLSVETAISDKDVKEAKLIAELIEKIEPEYSAYREAYDGAASRGITEKAIAIKAQEAVHTWARLHGAIDEALSEKRTPSAALLTNKALELEELVDKLKGKDS